MPKNFVHLHVHTELSMLDGLGKVQAYVNRAKALGMPALAVTDHGTVCAAPTFYHAARKAEIEPLIGEEFYFVPDVEEARNAKKARNTGAGKVDGQAGVANPDKDRYHVVIIARGYRGYRVLSELSTEAHRNFYYKPLLDRRTIEGLSETDKEELTVLSGCAASLLSQHIINKRMEEARQELLWWRDIFPHYYIELQHHNTAFDKRLNMGLLQLAQRYDIPWVVTNDPHYVLKEDACYHETLLALQTSARMDDEKRFKFEGQGYHLRSRAEMVKAFGDYERTVVSTGARNTIAIAKASRTRIPEWERRHWHIPQYPDTEDAQATLRRLTKEGLVSRGLWTNKVYRKRAKEELEVIKRAGIADFLLITRDIIEWAKAQGIPVGAGRGSVCGTLVGYLVDIHKIDPVRYNLLFERFLNPARPRMPDIDTDFGQARRDEIFEYITNKYGAENVLHVCAYQHMKVRKCFQKLAKAYSIPFQAALEISKSLNEDDEIVEQLPEELQEQYPELADQLTHLVGTKDAISKHPAGVIIGPPEMNIRQLVPEMWIASSKRMVAQYDLEAIEEMGLLKQDLLGLRTLDTIKECCDLVEQRTGQRPDPDSWVPDEEEGDEEIYTALAAGRTAGVFQMEGGTNTRGIQEIGCTSFEDIVSCTSLYRTGPIVAGFPAQFIANRKKGHKKILYGDPRLKPILEPTWGVILYQEQVMEIARVLAGFSMELVDDIKEAIKHKKSAFMQSLKSKFLEGCETNGVRGAAAEEVWSQIEGYSGYSYNRSHAVAYTLLTYQTARLKYLHPIEFYSALLRTVGDKEKRHRYLTECIENGIKLLPPDINTSGAGATPHGTKRAIRFGLADLAGIGPACVKKIEAGRAEHGGFQSVEQVEVAVGNKGYFAILVDGSTLRSLGIKGSLAKTEQLLGWHFKDRMEKYRPKYQARYHPPDGTASRVSLVGELYKIDKGKTKKGDPYLTWRIRWSPAVTYSIRLWQDTEDVWNTPVGSIVQVEGEWEPTWQNLAVSDPALVTVIRRSKKQSSA